MHRVIVDRRKALVGASALLAAPEALWAQRALVVTPGQTEGPFYPTVLPADKDWDLVRVQGHASQAVGRVTHISGRVLDKRGQVVAGARVEIWQCDANGVYDHPGSSSRQRRDTAFQGYGSASVDSSGRYVFRTIRPVAYPGRTPHIHFKVHAPGAGALTTQMYVEGEAQNQRDGVLRSIRDPLARESVIVGLTPGDDIEPGTLKGTFDIVLDL
jgi:protocatechuate 3,4-dioxygenase beta subunit